jgi:ankyrin repeat protein
VHCQLDYLGDCLPGSIVHALDELPETLDETYERTLRDIKSMNWEFARRLFLCVVAASRPFRVEELAEILALDFKAGPTPKFREDWRLEDPLEAVLSTCSTLLTLVNIDDSQVIQFSHFSVKEFMMSSRFAERRDNISSRYHLSMTSAHTLVAQTCLGVLLHLDNNVTRDSLQKFPLAQYAAEHWFEHARFEGVSENIEEGMKRLFDTRKPHFAVWVWIYDPFIPEAVWKVFRRPTKPVPSHRSPLHYATFCDLPSIVHLLVAEKPEDVNSRVSKAGWTTLHLASRMGHVEVARLLVEHGADVAARDEHESTALHFAVQEASVGLARLLIEHGANVAARDEYGSTPLDLAVRRGSVDLARLFVDYGADATGHDNLSLSHVVPRSGSVKPEVAGSFRRARIVEKKWSAQLELAVQAGNVDLARLLVTHGADVTAQDDRGSTLLHVATRTDSADIARFLVEHGVNARICDNDGLTPLRLAVRAGRVDLVRFLIEHGVDAAAPYDDESTLLHEASRSGRVDVSRLLIEHGAVATARDQHGSTPLHLAMRQGSEYLASLLIEHGADLTIADNKGSTPLHCAVEGGREDLARFLVEHHGAEVTDWDKLKNTLSLATQNGQFDLALFLLDHSADKMARDRPWWTPLHFAVEEQSLGLAQLLVKRGADTLVQDDHGSTLLHLIFSCQERRRCDSQGPGRVDSVASGIRVGI